MTRASGLRKCASFLFASLVLAGASIPRSSWAAAPVPAKFWGEHGLPVSVAPGYQFPGGAVLDGAGGVLFVFGDFRESFAFGRTVVQRLDAEGRPQWGAEGRAVAPGTGDGADQSGPVIVSDAAGGAIVAWQDSRNGITDVYAQRVGPDGTRLWPAGGVPLCGTVSPPCGPPTGVRIVEDGGGGVIAAWSDGFSARVQRVQADGTRMWPAGGVIVGGGSFPSPKVVSDGSGGAIVAWQSSLMIFAQRLDAEGTLLWDPDGVQVGGRVGVVAPSAHEIVADGHGGAIVVWIDGRNADADLYAQRIDADGAALWPSGGAAVSTGPGNQYAPAIVGDGAGGAIVAWEDQGVSPPGSGEQWILAQKLGADGGARWKPNGVAVYAAHGFDPHLVDDGAGGALVAFAGTGLTGGVFLGTSGVLGQRISSAGTVLWAAKGFEIAHFGGAGKAIGDGAGGIVAFWQDQRLAGDTSTDVFANRVNDQVAPPPTRKADLSVAMTATQEPVTIGNDLTYTLTVTNGGPDPATLVALSDTPPPGTTVVSISTPAGPCPGYNALTCSLGTIAPGGSDTATLVVRAEIGIDVHNVASVTGNELDPDPSNDSAELTTAVVYPVPVIDSLVPDHEIVGASGLDVHILGHGFSNGSNMRWNGQPRGGTIYGPTELAMGLSAADLAVVGSVPVTVTNPSPGGGTSNTLRFTVRPLPTLTVSDVAVPEGNAGTHPARFTVVLNDPPDGPATVRYATSAGTATPGRDYENVSGWLTFGPGVTSLPVDVPIHGDTLNEEDEAFVFTLSGASQGVVIARPVARCIVLNDDPVPSLSVADVRGKEGGLAVRFTVTLSAASGHTVTVHYATSDGSAVAGGDYVPASGTLVFAPGVRTRSLPVALVDDSQPEAAETIFVNLDGAVHATIARAQATAVIQDDDHRARGFSAAPAPPSGRKP